MSPQMTEKQFESAVVDICKLRGVRYYHTYDSRHSPSGYPDLTCVGPGGVLFRELKTAKGRLTLTQQTWQRALREAGADVAVWRPCDLTSGRIQRELLEIR